MLYDTFQVGVGNSKWFVSRNNEFARCEAEPHRIYNMHVAHKSMGDTKCIEKKNHIYGDSPAPKISR